MTDRLTINGDAVIEEDDSTGDITVDVSKITFGSDFELGIYAGSDGLNFRESGDFIARVRDGRFQFIQDGFLDMNAREIRNVREVEMNPVDVRTLDTDASSPGTTAYHDGSGTNTEGPAHYTSNDEWVSTVDGTTIS